jgi:hypothetical protein
MVKTILKFGVISGLVSAGLMLAYVPFMNFDTGAIFGYGGMLIAFLFVYFGVRSFRDRGQGGAITFGRAFGVGLGITVISCLFYVAAWEIVYFKFMPDFPEKYAAYAVEKRREAGASAGEIAAVQRQMDEFKAEYDKPLFNVAMTFAEPLPVGLIVTFVSAVALRRRKALSDVHPDAH